MWKYLPFAILFMIFQNIFMGLEAPLYGDMITDVQGEVADIWTRPQLKAKSLFVYFTIYPMLLYIYIKYVVDKGSLFEAFLFGFIVYYVADFTIFVVFSRGINHFFPLLFDATLVGGIGLALPLYLLRNYDYLSNNLLFLIGIFFISFWFVTYRVQNYTETKNLKLQQDKSKATQ
jgi:hypothetical protein